MGELEWNVDEQLDDRVEQRGFVGHKWVGARGRWRRVRGAPGRRVRRRGRGEQLAHERPAGRLPGARRRTRAQRCSCSWRVRRGGAGRGGRIGSRRRRRGFRLSRRRGRLRTVEQLDQLVVARLPDDVRADNAKSKQRVSQLPAECGTAQEQRRIILLYHSKDIKRAKNQELEPIWIVMCGCGLGFELGDFCDQNADESAQIATTTSIREQSSQMWSNFSRESLFLAILQRQNSIRAQKINTIKKRRGTMANSTWSQGEQRGWITSHSKLYLMYKLNPHHTTFQELYFCPNRPPAMWLQQGYYPFL